jgi:hypothetical protein
MKRTIAILATLVIVAVVAPAGAQDWVMDWTTRAESANSQPTTLSGTSPATLTPSSTPPMPSSFGPTWDLRFTYLGRTFGGVVGEGFFLSEHNSFSIPTNAPGFGGVFSSSLVTGKFSLTDNTFSLHATVAFPSVHSGELTATGTRNTTTASAIEPGVLLFSATALVGVVIMRRNRA